MGNILEEINHAIQGIAALKHFLPVYLEADCLSGAVQSPMC